MTSLREITGYIAHVLLAGYWLWALWRTAPQLRRSSRARSVRLHVLTIKTLAVGLTALVVGVIHFWATQWWHVAAALGAAIGCGLLLHRAYRQLVAAPRHRRPLTQRARRRRGTPAPDNRSLQARLAPPRHGRPSQYR